MTAYPYCKMCESFEDQMDCDMCEDGDMFVPADVDDEDWEDSAKSKHRSAQYKRIMLRSEAA